MVRDKDSSVSPSGGVCTAWFRFFLNLTGFSNHPRPADSSRLHASWRVGLGRRVSLIHTGVLRVRGMSVARSSPSILPISLSVLACRGGIFAMSFSALSILTDVWEHSYTQTGREGCASMIDRSTESSQSRGVI
ncbi:uncharacterized protein ARMOST_05870 [Armillaria ostoyae]|uniref:Uncharacterized protein n=1 Tax=Armillaria ostoyae TaxID=47428 RepID=A0A284R1F3_ARMOS|nr:uncharacterized protein ARMOST_05870 [Armillaria ostoyae]